MRGFTDRPKTLTSKRAFTNEDVPKPKVQAASSSMPRASTNDDLLSMEIEALGTTPPSLRDEWAHKQLMGMVNRSADGQRVVGEEDDFPESLSPLSHRSAFATHGKAKSTIEGIDHNNLGQSQQLAPTPRTAAIQARLLTSSSSTSALPIGGLRRETKSTSFENRLRLKREKDQHMARMIMEEEHKKARDREKLREAEERMRAKVREQQEQHRQSFYDPIHEKQPNHSTSPQHSGDDNFAYFRQMRKKIKDINVKPTLPSIGLDEKLKKLNTRVKGFLNTNPPSFSLPIQKLREKRNSTKIGKNIPIKLNIVDDYLKDLELQRMAEESSLDSRDGLSPTVPRAGYDDSANSSPSEAQQNQIKRSRKRAVGLRLANNSTSELQLLVRALGQDLQANNEAIAAAQQTCANIRAEMERSKTIFTIDVDTTTNKITKASTLGTQFVTTVKDIRTQLNSTRVATVACSDQIKELEVNVQKVQRAKKPTDKLVRYLFWLPLSILLLYMIIKSPTCQMLVVVSVFIWIMRMLRERSASAAQQLQSAQVDIPVQYDVRTPQYEPEDLSTSSELQSPDTPSHSPHIGVGTTSSSSSSSSSSSIRRNHSDLVLQSLLSEEEFAEVLQDSPKKLHTVKEDDQGISPKPKSKSKSSIQIGGNNKMESQEASKIGISSSRSGAALRGPPLRTSATNKESVAMNLAIHNLNQMSLKIQQMQQGK